MYQGAQAVEAKVVALGLFEGVESKHQNLRTVLLELRDRSVGIGG
jgi:hypothetical protein